MLSDPESMFIPYSEATIIGKKAERNRFLLHWPRRGARIGLGTAFGMMLLLGGLPCLNGQTRKDIKHVATPTLHASRNSDEALVKAAATERAYYTVCMNLIQREWETNHIAHVLELLEETKASRYRGFEWGYWNRLCHRETRMLKQGARAVAVSADGHWIATGDKHSTVRLWDADTGQEIWAEKEKPIQGWVEAINSIAFTPDGTRLLTMDAQSNMTVWDVKSGQRLQTRYGGYSGTRSAFSADGSQVVLNARGTWGAVRDVESGKDLLKNKTEQCNQFESIAFAPDGKRFVTCNDDNAARIWNATTGNVLLTLTGHQHPICSVAFSPDGAAIATASQDQTVKLWDARTGDALRSLASSPGAVNVVCFSPDGKTLVTGSADGVTRVWDAATGMEKRAIKGHTHGVEAVAFFPDGKRLVTSSEDGTTKIWDLDAEEKFPMGKKPAGQRPQPVNATIGHVMTGMMFGVREFSPDGNLVVVSSANNAAVWDIPAGVQRVTLQGHADRIISIGFSPDSLRITTVSLDRSAKLWDARMGALLGTVKGGTGAVTSLAFLPDNRQIVIGSEEGTAKIWDSRSWKEVRTLKHSVAVLKVRVVLSGSRIVTYARDGMARIWNTITGRQTGAFLAGAEEIESMTLSPAADRAVTYNTYQVKLWNVVTGTKIRDLPMPVGALANIVFSPDGQRLVTGNYNEDFHVWDTDTGREIIVLPHSPRPISGVRFSPDGQRFVLDCMDGYSRPW